MPHPHEIPIGHHSLDPKGPFYVIKELIIFENAEMMKPLKSKAMSIPRDSIHIMGDVILAYRRPFLRDMI